MDKAVTVCQPKAWALVHGFETALGIFNTAETADVQAGTQLWIHASRSVWNEDLYARLVMGRAKGLPNPSVLRAQGGRVLGRVTVVRLTYSDEVKLWWATVANGKALGIPWPCRGDIGIWDVRLPVEVLTDGGLERRRSDG